MRKIRNSDTMNRPAAARPRSLVSQVADLIRERIESGQLGPSLAGEEEVGRLFDVSRPTVRGALALLEAAGVLEKARKGLARKVNPGWFGRSKPAITARLLIAQPLHEMTAGTQAGIRQTRLRLLSHGVQVTFQVSTAFRAQNPARTLAKDLSDANPDVWLVVDATPQMEGWFEKRQLPAVFVGGSYGHTLPRAGGDGDQAIRAAATRLLDLGHRRIVYLLHNAYGVQMVDPFREVMLARGAGWDERYNVLRWKDDAANLYPMIERMFSSAKPPTAFIALGVRNLLPLVSWTAQHGLCVPRDFSVIQVLDDPTLEYFYPPITRFVLDRDKLCHAVTELALQVARAGKPSNVAEMIPMFEVSGRSVAPPRK
jgi:DNA-binding LacI/PurR family transcriptional regulator